MLDPAFHRLGESSKSKGRVLVSRLLAGALVTVPGMAHGQDQTLFDLALTSPDAYLAIVGIADVDADGYLDVVRWVEEDIHFLRGRADETFEPAVVSVDVVPTAGPTRHSDFADLDGDGDLDFVAHRFMELWTVLGNGDGTFSAIQSDVLQGPVGGDLALLDFDGDGDLDVAAPEKPIVRILANDGSGAFTSELDLPHSVVGSVYSLSSIDLDADGRKDLVLIDADAPGSPGLQPFLVLGQGQIVALPPQAVGASPFVHAVTADFDGDGRADFAAGSAADTTELLVGLGNGDGTFRLHSTPLSFSFSNSDLLSVCDIDGDAFADLVLGDKDGTDCGQTVVLRSDGLGSFTQALALDFANDGVFPLDDSSGALDLLFEFRGAFRVSLDSLVLPRLPASIAAGFEIDDVAIADMNADGFGDLVWTESGFFAVDRLFVSLGDGRGGFAPPSTARDGEADFHVADVDADGALDVCFASLSGAGSIGIQHGDGAGGFRGFTTVGIGGASPTWVRVGDMLADGAPDLVVGPVGALSQQVAVVNADGSGGFEAARRFSTGAVELTGELLDADLDGHLDLAALHDGAGLSLLLGDGAGNLAPPIDIPLLLTFVEALAVDDLNADGAPDLAVLASVAASSADIEVLVNDGSGGFSTGPGVELGLFGLGDFPAFALGDFDADGLPDVAVASADAHGFAVALNQDGSSFGPLGSYWHGDVFTNSVAAGDLTGDGRDDLFFGGRDRCGTTTSSTARPRGRTVLASDPANCATNLGFGGPGASVLSLCGAALLGPGKATLAIERGRPGAVALLAASLSAMPVPAFGGTIVPNPVELFLVLPLNNSGAVELVVPGLAQPTRVYLQAGYVDALLPGGVSLSNALEADFGG